MKKGLLFLALALVVAPVAASAVAVEGTPVRPDVDQRNALDAALSDYAVFEVSLADVRAGAEAGWLELKLGNRSFALEMERVNILAEGFQWVMETEDGRVEVAPGESSNFNGRMIGNESARVRLSSRPNHFGGYVRTAEEWLFIDPLAEIVDGAPKNLVVVYRDEDVRPDDTRMCGSERLSDIGKSLIADIGNLDVGKGENPEGGFPIAEFALEVDGNYFEDYGDQGTKDRIKDVMFEVIDIYESELQLTLKFGYGHIWTDAGTDPYTSNDAGTTLDQFVDYWLDNEPFNDIIHMFSGKNFNFGVAGIAYLGQVCCDTGFFGCAPGPFGISQDLFFRNDRITVTAHEIGHNFNANHDNQFPVNCPGVSCSGSGPIMCSSIQSNGSLEFSSCSIDDIDDYVAGNSGCLD